MCRVRVKDLGIESKVWDVDVGFVVLRVEVRCRKGYGRKLVGVVGGSS